jgi:metal-dependent amidase/aminoacylase/carboxypeptidase family protein
MVWAGEAVGEEVFAFSAAEEAAQADGRIRTETAVWIDDAAARIEKVVRAEKAVSLCSMSVRTQAEAYAVSQSTSGNELEEAAACHLSPPEWRQPP